MSRGARNAVDAIGLLVLPATLVTCALLRLQASALLTLLAAVVSLGIFFAGWERSNPGLRQIMPTAVLVAAAVAGRIIFAAAPNIQPVTALCIMAGAVFGRRTGFMTGAMTGLVSGFFLGLGAWTPWQMYAWGVVGYASGVAFCKKGDKTTDVLSPSKRTAPTFAVMTFGFAASFAFGFIMNTWTLIGFAGPMNWGSAIAVYGAGFAFDLAHGISTVLFLAILYAPLGKKLDRVASKYGLMGVDT